MFNVFAGGVVEKFHLAAKYQKTSRGLMSRAGGQGRIRKAKRDGRTDGRTDRRTDRRTEWVVESRARD